MSYHHRASQTTATGAAARCCQRTAKESGKETAAASYATAVHEKGTITVLGRILRDALSKSSKNCLQLLPSTSFSTILIFTSTFGVIHSKECGTY